MRPYRDKNKEQSPLLHHHKKVDLQNKKQRTKSSTSPSQKGRSPKQRSKSPTSRSQKGESPKQKQKNENRSIVQKIKKIYKTLSPNLYRLSYSIVLYIIMYKLIIWGVYNDDMTILPYHKELWELVGISKSVLTHLMKVASISITNQFYSDMLGWVSRFKGEGVKERAIVGPILFYQTSDEYKKLSKGDQKVMNDIVREFSKSTIENPQKGAQLMELFVKNNLPKLMNDVVEIDLAPANQLMSDTTHDDKSLLARLNALEKRLQNAQRQKQQKQRKHKQQLQRPQSNQKIIAMVLVVMFFIFFGYHLMIRFSYLLQEPRYFDEYDGKSFGRSVHQTISFVRNKMTGPTARNRIAM